MQGHRFSEDSDCHWRSSAEGSGCGRRCPEHAVELENWGIVFSAGFWTTFSKGRPEPQRLEALLFAGAVAKRILKERSEFDVVNLHAPWGGVYGIWRKVFRPSGTHLMS